MGSFAVPQFLKSNACRVTRGIADVSSDATNSQNFRKLNQLLKSKTITNSS